MHDSARVGDADEPPKPSVRAAFVFVFGSYALDLLVVRETELPRLARGVDLLVLTPLYAA